MLVTVVLFLMILAVTGIVFGQAQNGCIRLTGKEYPRYKVGRSELGGKGDSDQSLLLYISVDPKTLTRDSMIKLAKRIKNDFCREKRIQAIIFDQYKIAKRFVPHPHSKTYAYDMKNMKGGYFLDRTTGEEYISYSIAGKGLADEQKIVLTHKKQS